MFSKSFLASFVLLALATAGFADQAANTIPAGKQVAQVTAFPEKITLEGPFAYAQVLITAVLESGEQVDLTRTAERVDSSEFVSVTSAGLVSPLEDGTGELVFRAAGHDVKVPFEVIGSHADYQADFVRDVTPAMSKMGCNAGTCHGAKDGKNGFKLSLRGYDPIYDHRALVDDVAGRRFNRAVPEQSLMLLKNDRHRSTRWRFAHPARGAALRDPQELDRRRGAAKLGFSQGCQDRPLSAEPNRAAARHDSAVRRLCDFDRRTRARRDRRLVHLQR